MISPTPVALVYDRNKNNISFYFINYPLKLLYLQSYLNATEYYYTLRKKSWLNIFLVAIH